MQGNYDNRPLAFAIGADNLENVKLLCDRGADLNTLEYDRTPLTIACNGTRFRIVHYLLERGVDYNYPTSRNDTFTFVFSLKQKTPDDYVSYPDDTAKWCQVVWDWMIAHGADPNKAIWDGTKWKWEKDEKTDNKK